MRYWRENPEQYQGISSHSIIPASKKATGRSGLTCKVCGKVAWVAEYQPEYLCEKCKPETLTIDQAKALKLVIDSMATLGSDRLDAIEEASYVTGLPHEWFAKRFAALAGAKEDSGV